MKNSGNIARQVLIVTLVLIGSSSLAYGQTTSSRWTSNGPDGGAVAWFAVAPSNPKLIYARAFVLMQYFGYLRCNPNDAPDTNFDGYNFWLNTLNQFDGNFVNAEMVKAFLQSPEYRNRFAH